MSRVGPTRAIWRQSSEPIEPPAPVTSTVWPLRYEATLSKSTSTCSRPSTSSTCTGRIWPARFTSPVMSSYSPGSVFTGHVRAPARPRRPGGASRRRRTGSRSAPRPACTRARCAAARPSSRATRTPRMRVLRLRGSSSTKPIGVYASRRERCISWTISRPASPAPTTMTSLPRATTPKRGRSISVRASSRAPATSASVIRRSIAAIERGRRTLCTGEAK